MEAIKLPVKIEKDEQISQSGYGQTSFGVLDSEDTFLFETFDEGHAIEIRDRLNASEGWVAVEERTPEKILKDECDEYLIAFLDFRDKKTPCVSTAYWAKKEHGKWRFCSEDLEPYNHIQITHWKPLPAPPITAGDRT